MHFWITLFGFIFGRASGFNNRRVNDGAFFEVDA
tara:strand:- start:379 stop:480 length:102 start_codon:yes stop_codon:yes gene_type:complete